MEHAAIELLQQHRIMALATLRPDGWPQTTMVCYANRKLRLFFIISRTSQKFSNLSRDDRVSIALGELMADPRMTTGLSMAAHVSEVTGAEQREEAYRLLLQRHPAFTQFPRPDPNTAAIMQAAPEIISIVNFAKGYGHTDVITVGANDLVLMQPATMDDWGLLPRHDKHA